MKELYTGKDIFTMPCTPACAVCITTNGVIKKDGNAVMGAGIAKQARDKWPAVEEILGRYLKSYGNRPFVLGKVNPYGTPYHLLSLPTKHNWKECSDITLIYQSCELLMEMADKWHFETIYLPPPGCGKGNLNYEVTVRPWVSNILDDRFVCVLR